MAQSTLHSILDAIEESSSVEDQGMDEAALMPDAIERTLEDLKQLQQTSSMIPASMSIICVSEPKESSVEPDAELGTDEANVDEPSVDEPSAEQTNKAENKQKGSSQSIEMGPEPEQEAEFEAQAGLANDTGAIHPLSSQVQHQQQPHHPCPTCGNGTTSSNGSIRATSTTDAQLLQQVEQLQRDMACLMDLVRKERMEVSLYRQSTAENSERDDMSSVEQESQETRRSDEPQQAKGRPSNADDNRGSVGTLGRAWSLLRSPFSYIGP
ncbi:hypothetical protein BCR43DRAFT_307960 [Syncephalastrum racemosum]|uniref:Uncharacterized protein n=1 Tax=Syncephalastrum racemosum TaxID=13706 RepID=A0A1X2HAE8_SYNRA|nr:hypothetical protein BCR43DRAFT_307960 [Syncephalastrum racemosum]